MAEEKAQDPDFVKWRKAKKVAVMLSFVGKEYLGMQRNPGFKTIEEDLMKAFKEAGTISEEWYENLQKAHFQRASRTDKGVSAARMVVSLKMGKNERFLFYLFCSSLFIVMSCYHNFRHTIFIGSRDLILILI